MKWLYFVRKHRKIGYKVKWFYYTICKRDKIQRKTEYGSKNQEKYIYIVKPDSEDCVEGLLSLAARASLYIREGKRKGYDVFVDWQNYRTQYYVEGNNSWNYYFKQPSLLSIEEVYQSKNVILSGWTFNDINAHSIYSKYLFFDKTLSEECHSTITESLVFSDEVTQMINQESRRLNIENCIGIYVRGTDYIRMKPSGEYVQPEISDFIAVVRDFAKLHSGYKIFVVTEDGSIYETLKKEFRETLVTASFDTFIYDYSGREFLSKSQVLNEDRKKRGIDYLVKIALLAKCRFLVTSITMGSMFAFGLNGGKYEDYYVFDLGLYP